MFEGRATLVGLVLLVLPHRLQAELDNDTRQQEAADSCNQWIRGHLHTSDENHESLIFEVRIASVPLSAEPSHIQVNKMFQNV